MCSSIATGRIDFGLSRFSLAVRYRDDYGIDAKLSALVEGAGLEIGGKFETHHAAVWQTEGSFVDGDNAIIQRYTPSDTEEVKPRIAS